jgi:DSF synthase
MNSCDVNSLPIVFESPAMTARKDEVSSIIWNEWHPQPRPCVTLELLKDFRVLYNRVASGEEETDWFVTWSSHPSAFSLGGDLDLFRRCVQEKDWATLDEYADLCIDAIFSHVAMDFVIAEPAAEFGLPEMLFNLFPGMGAYSLLARKIGPQKAKSFILEGHTHHSTIMHEFGLIDQMAPAGQGIDAAARFISRWHKQRHGLRTFSLALRQAATEIAKSELTAIVRQWVDAARGLTARDLRMMDLLVKAQLRLKATPPPLVVQESTNPFQQFPVNSISPFAIKQVGSAVADVVNGPRMIPNEN